MPNHDWRSLRSILVANLDTPTAIEPALTALRQALPQAEVAAVTLRPDRPLEAILDTLKQSAFEAAIVFTAAGQSPYAIAYLCYLAGVPIRVGQSIEFGGGVLSDRVPPAGGDRHLHLLRAVGIVPIACHSAPHL